MLKFTSKKIKILYSFLILILNIIIATIFAALIDLNMELVNLIVVITLLLITTPIIIFPFIYLINKKRKISFDHFLNKNYSNEEIIKKGKRFHYFFITFIYLYLLLFLIFNIFNIKLIVVNDFYLTLFSLFNLYQFVFIYFLFIFYNNPKIVYKDDDKTINLEKLVLEVAQSLSLSQIIEVEITNQSHLYVFINQTDLFLQIGINQLMFYTDEELKTLIYNNIFIILNLKKNKTYTVLKFINFIKEENLNNNFIGKVLFTFLYPFIYHVKIKDHIYSKINNFPFVDEQLKKSNHYEENLTIHLQTKAKGQIFSILDNNIFLQPDLVKTNNYYYELYDNYINFYNKNKTVLENIYMNYNPGFNEDKLSINNIIDNNKITNFEIVFPDIKNLDFERAHFISSVNRSINYNNEHGLFEILNPEELKTAIEDFKKLPNELTAINLIEKSLKHLDEKSFNSAILFLKQTSLKLAKSYVLLGEAKLFYFLDETAIEDFYEAIKLNESYIPISLDYINYIVETFNLEGEFEKLISYQKVLLDFYYNTFSKGLVLNKNDTLVDVIANKDDIKQIIKFASLFDEVKQLNIGTKVISDDYNTSVLLIQFNNNVLDSKINYILEELTSLLEGLEDHYTLINFVHKKLLKPYKNINSIIYQKGEKNEF